MELYEFRKDFLEDIRSTAISENDSKVNTFSRIICDYLVEFEIIPSFELCFIKADIGKKRNLTMDAYSYDNFDKSLTVIISIYDDSEKGGKLVRTEVDKVFKRGRYLIEEVLKGKLNYKYDISTIQYDFANDIYSKRSDISKIKFLIITDLELSDRIDKLKGDNIEDKKVEFSIWDIKRLYNVLSSKNVSELLKIDFTEYTECGIPVLLANTQGSIYKSYLGVIPGEVLANIYDEYGSRLLEGNVRSFLSVKGSVNRNIRKSILGQPEMFFAYNNGISVTARNIVLNKKDNALFLVGAEDFQIVNGGQTTASLAAARYKDKADLSKIYVQMKLTEVEGDEGQKIIPDISRCSNSQNKVSEADFFSTSPYHIRIEQFSRRLFAPATDGNQYDTHWFYERARGQYSQEQMKLTPTQKKKFTAQNPKKQVITKTDLAKYVNSWEGLPHIVSKGAQANFLAFANLIDPKWNENDELFNEKYFKDIVSLAILFKSVEKIVSNQSWYQNAYRANLVTYSIALFSEKIKKQYKGYEFDFLKIWNKQEMPIILVNIFEEITKLVFDSITSPGRATMNVTQWCKKEICWTKVKEIDYELSDNISNLLIDKREKKKIDFEYKKEQKFENEIEAQKRVINLGEAYWKKILEFGKDKGILNYNDEKVIGVAIAISRGRIPSAKQCEELFIIVNRLEDEGFIS